VFAGAVGDFSDSLTVTDTKTGETRRYDNVRSVDDLFACP